MRIIAIIAALVLLTGCPADEETRMRNETNEAMRKGDIFTAAEIGAEVLAKEIRKSARAGDVKAQYELGEYFYGEAVKWYTRAAAEGLPRLKRKPG